MTVFNIIIIYYYEGEIWKRC